MRLKFQAPQQPSENEIHFIELVDKFHDTYGLREETLSTFLQISRRKVRQYKERYNNYKYIDYAPQGKLVVINGLYKLVRNDSIYQRRTQLQAEYNFICALIDKRNTERTIGKLQAIGQVSIYDYTNMDYDELINAAIIMEEELDE